ncbi:MAG: winged helix-turn-helix domain-containing protein [Rhodanobacteraceae bacterium]|nr:winged helix-turn-helix domain-containing protein [Rhodanobacteraceae bacterium]
MPPRPRSHGAGKGLRCAFAARVRELWGPDDDEDSHYLRILVGKLRRKLGDDPVSPQYIETEPGVGLRWRAE